MTIARDLAKYGLGFNFDTLPKEVVHEGKRLILDALGCGIGAYSGDACQIIHRLVVDLG